MKLNILRRWQKRETTFHLTDYIRFLKIIADYGKKDGKGRWYLIRLINENPVLLPSLVNWLLTVKLVTPAGQMSMIKGVKSDTSFTPADCP